MIQNYLKLFHEKLAFITLRIGKKRTHRQQLDVYRIGSFSLTISLVAYPMGEVKQKVQGKNQKILKSNSAARLQSFLGKATSSSAALQF